MTGVDYILQIFAPGNDSTYCVEFVTSSPFGAISRGDVLYPMAWGANCGVEDNKKVWRVRSVEHFISKEKDMRRAKHLVRVFTDEIDNLAPLNAQG